MPKLICRCGFIHNLSNIPDDGFLVIRDKDYEPLLELESKREVLGSRHPRERTVEWEELIDADVKVVKILERFYECPDCKRLIWLREDGKANVYELSED